jgi:hypothetical protein
LYDSKAIFSGSCNNDVDGRMTLIYPGVCDKGTKDCNTGTTINIAWPSDTSDPLATNFTKASYNPVAHCNASVGPGGSGPPGSGGDPSSAFKTASGEWRIVTRDQINQTIWASMDFKSWYWVGPQPNFPQGACPSFFALPKTTPGAREAPPGAETPTHVYMYSDTLLPQPNSHQSVAVVGTYTDRGARRVASFDATPGIDKGLDIQIIDNGSYYAAKVSGLQAHKLLQIYTNTDYCLVAFSTWIPPTRTSTTRSKIVALCGVGRRVHQHATRSLVR